MVGFANVFLGGIEMSGLDIYHQWLGIKPEEQPPSLYRLLGVSDFEQNTEVIRNAAERQAMHVRRLARGEFTDVGQELLNEIAAAKIALMNPSKRLAYDQSLRSATPEAELENGLGATLMESPKDAHQSQPYNRGDDEKLVISPIDATYIDLESAESGVRFKDRWIVGYHPECDFRVDGQTVSGIHCQITRTRNRLYISDLSSTNGTYVNQERVQETKRLGPLDLITLGRDHRITLPERLMPSDDHHEAVAIFVGRGKGNELQLDSRRVSPFHARLIFRQRSVIVEDLRSKDGTFIQREGAEAMRIDRIRLRKHDVLRFADVRVSANEILDLGRKR
jgi:pSer/pThr/pTyr-binding forkhead associated (FHA) protein